MPYLLGKFTPYPPCLIASVGPGAGQGSHPDAGQGEHAS